MATISTTLKEESNLSYVKALNSVDWSFGDVRNGGIHSFHWYPATFPSAIPGTLIPLLSSPGDLIVDPFCGSSTTGIEAVRLGRSYYGFDTNPIAILISRAKHYFPTRKALLKQFDFEKFSNNWLTPVSYCDHPQESELRSWYHPSTYNELGYLLETIIKIENTELKASLQAVFSSILKSTSSQTKHWGWVCDNVKPKKNEIQYKDAFVAFEKALDSYLNASEFLITDMKHRGVDANRSAIRRRARVRHVDCITGLKSLESGSVPLILTSPPYYGVADYIKSQRLSYLWFDHSEIDALGYKFDDFNELRQIETGSRSHRHRKNSFDLYMDYMRTFFIEAHRVIQENGNLALIIGESNSRQSTTEEIINCASLAGFDLIYRKERNIKHTRRRLMAKVKNEDVLVFSISNKS